MGSEGAAATWWAARWSATVCAASASDSYSDLAAKNAELEQHADPACATPRADLVREASVRAQLQRYVSPRLVDLAIANPDLLPAPGDWREATVLFADIRGFTRLIESTPAPVVIGLLDEYFAEMIDVIFRHQGTVEQLIGDEIVALFGVPEAGPDAAQRAVLAATRHGGRGPAPCRALGRRRAGPPSTSGSGSAPAR